MLHHCLGCLYLGLAGATFWLPPVYREFAIGILYTTVGVVYLTLTGRTDTHLKLQVIDTDSDPDHRVGGDQMGTADEGH